MIHLTDWIATIPSEDKYIAYVGENETVSREFYLPDLAYKDYDFYLDLAFDLSTVTTTVQPRSVVTTQQSTTEKISADGTSVTATENTSQESYTQGGVTVDHEDKTDIVPLLKSVEDDGVHLYWTVRAQHTQLPGLLRATLRALGGVDKVKKSAMMVFYVAPSVAATPAAPIQLTEYEQMERAMVEALQREADKTLATFSEKLGDAEDLKEYIDDKVSPATAETYGTVKVAPQSMGSGVYMDAEGSLQIQYATEDEINTADKRFDFNILRPIDPRTLVCYVHSKASPANMYGDYGTVKFTGIWDSALSFDDDGCLVLRPATEEEIGNRENDTVKKYKRFPITIGTLDYAVKAVGDGYYALQSDLPAPAEYGTDKYGTIKLPLGGDRACGFQIDENGCLKIRPATEEEIDNRAMNPYGYIPITLRTLDYAVKAVGDGYYALASDVGDVETALDGILAMQNALIGGDAV